MTQIKDLTREQAITAMNAGHKVRHRYFTPDEWVKQVQYYYEFEDGVQCTAVQLWQDRSGKDWQTGWSIVEAPVENKEVLAEGKANKVCSYCGYLKPAHEDKCKGKEVKEESLYVKFNLNHEVRVKLKEDGYKYWQIHHNKFLPEHRPLSYFKEQTKDDGYVKFQFWEFMEIFGASITFGRLPIFETDVLFLKSELKEL